MSVVNSENVAELLRGSGSLTPELLKQLQTAVAGPQFGEMRQAVTELSQTAGDDPGEELLARLGVSCFFLAWHHKADEFLSRVEKDGIAICYHAHTLSSLERYEESAKRYEVAGRQGYDQIDATLRTAGCLRALGRIDEAEKMLRSIAALAASRAEYSFQMGCIWADLGDALTAVEYFERAVDMDPHHSRALFWLAADNSLRGNDIDAIRLYERSLAKPPYFVGALLNLGLLYEDHERYETAAFCFERILDVDPTNERVQLYLRDIEATHNMHVNEEEARHEARMKQLLERPVTDFELSVRSRNCLLAMDINSLGDLTEVSEQELLAGKNFGETSLMEIRELLSAHGLHIGQNLHRVHSRETFADQNMSPEEQATMNRPISDLNLSVRSRKCMSRLSIQTLGRLLQRTPDELLSTRNFGVTSLNEIRAKLSEIDLRLRND